MRTCRKRFQPFSVEHAGICSSLEQQQNGSSSLGGRDSTQAHRVFDKVSSIPQSLP